MKNEKNENENMENDKKNDKMKNDKIPPFIAHIQKMRLQKRNLTDVAGNTTDLWHRYRSYTYR